MKFESKEEKVLAIAAWVLATSWGSFLLANGVPVWGALIAGSVVAVTALIGPKWAANRLLSSIEAEAWARAQLVMEAMASYYDQKERRTTGYAAYRAALKGRVKDASIDQWWEERWSS